MRDTEKQIEIYFEPFNSEIASPAQKLRGYLRKETNQHLNWLATLRSH